MLIGHTALVKMNHIFSPVIKSSFTKVVRVYENVLKFIKKCSVKMIEINPSKHIVLDRVHNSKLSQEAVISCIKSDQYVHFGEIFEYFHSRRPALKDIPPIVNQLNVFVDHADGLLRVKTKFSK